jgi:HAD superfamily hydrolase (TIGR01509 family)
MIRGIIFDCFGVLCQGSLDYFVSQATPEVRQEVIDANRSADYGYIDHDEYIAIIATLLNKSPEELEEVVRKFHVRNEPMFDIVRSLKPQYKVGLLSNVGDNVIEHLLSEDELTNVFDAVVLSGQVGMVKPNPNIFELTAAKLGLLPEECVMIDDIPRNIQGAKAIGMKGIVCSSPTQVQLELTKLLEESHA